MTAKAQYEVVGTGSPCARLWSESLTAAVTNYARAFRLQRGVVLARPLTDHGAAEMFEVGERGSIRPLHPGGVK